ncbi:hypothetical protein KKF64_02615 [Patescibacteria group bacterium]|nr:hypothetical protein [Patescibacteria group bacterium]
MLDEIINKITASEEAKLSKNLTQGASDAISDEKVFVDYQKRAFIALQYSKSKQAYQILKKLKSVLLNHPQEIQNKYLEIIVWFTYASFDYLSQQELISFFKEANFLIILRDENYGDLINRLRQRLRLEALRNRNSLREKIYHALHENNVIFSQKGMKEQDKGTISYWLKSYDVAVGIDPVNALDRVEFENKAVIEAKLDADSKNLLKRLLDFYEFVKLSSFELSAFEEDMVMNDGKNTYLLTSGNLIEIDEDKKSPSQNKVAPEKEVKSALPKNDQITQTARAMLNKTSGNIELTLNNLDQAIQSKNILSALALLMLLSQLRKLDDILSDPSHSTGRGPRFSKMVADDLKKNNQDDKVQGLKINPRAPQFIARFLKIILEDKLELSREDAIRFGKKLSQILSIESEKYQSIIKDNKWNM